MNYNFEINKIKRIIDERGSNFSFKRFYKNDFGEVDDMAIKTITLKGLFHTVKKYISIENNEATRLKSVTQEMILTTYDYYNQDRIQIDDILKYNNKTYRVSGINNLEEKDFAIDISLEMMQ